MPKIRIGDIKSLIASSDQKVVPLSNFGYTKPRSRKLINFHPLGGGEDWGVHQNSLSNIERALVERVYTVKGSEGVRVLPPAPEPGVLKQRLKNFRRKLIHYCDRVVPLTTNQFVESYTGRKRALYTSAAESLLNTGIRRSDAYIQSFIKDEKTNLTRKDDPCPRIIQPRSARFNVAIGCHLKPMEKEIFRGIARVFRGRTVMKGLNAEQRGAELHRKWGKFKHPIALLLDAARFDQHVSEEAIEWEHGIEEKLTTDPDDLRRLNNWRRKNVCFARVPGGGFKYTTRGKRMSGDMDTAMANCMLMCAMTESFMTDLEVIHEYMNDGDDGVLIFEEEHLTMVLASYEAYFLALGFTMKLEGVARTMEEVEFCQARPIFDGTGWRFVRDPRVCVGKDSLSLKGLINPDEMQELRNSIGWCGLSLAGDMPIFGAFYSTMISSARPDQEFTTGMQFLARGMEPKFSEPTEESRLSFQRAYDIAPDDQLAIENHIRSLPTHLQTTALPVDTFSTFTYTSLNFK